jgi:hypothetical protein
MSATGARMASMGALMASESPSNGASSNRFTNVKRLMDGKLKETIKHVKHLSSCTGDYSKSGYVMTPLEMSQQGGPLDMFVLALMLRLNADEMELEDVTFVCAHTSPLSPRGACQS